MSDKDLMSVIKNLNEKWMSDFSKGDAVSVGSHYTEDAVSLAPGCKPIVGKKAIIEYWAQAIKSGAGALNIKSKEVERSGDIVVEIGETDLLNSGDEIIDQFNYMVIWKQEAGEWLIHREIWNSR